MSEWTITIETGAGVTSDENALEAFGAYVMERSTRALGAAAGFNTSTGVPIATFQVEADDPTAAVSVAVDEFAEALHSAGLLGDFGVLPIARPELEPVDAEEPIPA